MSRTSFFMGAILTVVASVLASIVTVKLSLRNERHAGITTQAVSLVDSAGNVVARLSSEQGDPEFALFDQQHRKRVALFVERSGAPDLYLYDSAGTARAAVNLFDSGVPNFAYSNGAGPFAISYLPETGDYRVAMDQMRGNKMQVLGTLDFSIVNNKPKLKILDKDGHTSWQTP